MTKKTELAELLKQREELDRQIAALAAPPKRVKKERPANVRPDDEKEEKEKYKRVGAQYMDWPEELEDKDNIVPEGKYIVSFALKLLVKDRGYSTRLVTENYNTDGNETQSEILDYLSEKYIAENESYLHDYADNDVEIMAKEQVKFTPQEDVKIGEIKARRGHPLQYKTFPADLHINKNQGECVLDIVMAAAAPVWPKFTRQKLIEELKAVAKDGDDLEKGICTRQIMDWAASRKRVSVYALDPFMSVYAHHIASHHCDFSVCYITNNGHAYPITDADQKQQIARTKKLDLQHVKFSAGMETEAYISWDDALGMDPPADVKQVHVDTDDLSELLKEVVRKTGYLAVGIMASGPLIVAFEHPVSHQIYIASKDYLQRKEVCSRSLQETRYIGFVWRNQSWAEIFQAWQDVMVGDIPASTYSVDSLMIHETYPQSAYVGRTRDVDDDEELKSYDLDKAYSSCLLTNLMPFPVETVFDEIKVRTTEDLPCGKAYIARSFMLGQKKYSRAFYPSFFVQYCLVEEAIEWADVTHIMQAARTLDGTTFRPMVTRLRELFPAVAKRIINNGIGAWGRRYRKQASVAITDSFQTALGMADQDKHVRLSEIGSFWFLRKETRELLPMGHVGMREHIVCMGHIKLHQMEKRLTASGCEIIAWNTDSIKVIPSGAVEGVVPKKEAKPGDMCEEESINLKGKLVSEMEDRPEYVHRDLAWTDLQPIELSYDENQHRGMLVTGGPGHGKSFRLKQLQTKDTEDELKTAKLTWTRTAALNIDGETLDHVFPKESTRAEWIAKGCTFDTLYIDEFSIIPEYWFGFFQQLKLAKPALRFRFFGDQNQLHSDELHESKTQMVEMDVDGSTELVEKRVRQKALWFRYHSSKLMHTLVGGYRIALPYVTGAARYDADLRARIDDFEQTRTLASFSSSGLFEPDECLFNIVKTDAMRTKINKQWVDALAPEDAMILDTRKGPLKLWKGMFLISHSNEGAIVNSTRYKVLNLTETLVGLKSDAGDKIAVPYRTIASTCRYGYADTIMRIISRTLTGRFNIHEVHQMEWNQLYVALSRARTASSIGMEFKPDRQFKMAQPPALGVRVVVAPMLIEGKLYVRTDGKRRYIGKTLQEEDVREAQHRDSPVSKKVAAWEAEMGGAIKMTVLESYLVKDTRQLGRREMELIAAIPEDVCMNTCGVKKAVADTSTRLDTVEVDYSRFSITEDEKKHRFRIQWRENGQIEERVFRWGRKTREDARRDAEEKRADLIKKFFI